MRAPLGYAHRGLAVFPCTPGRKTPAVSRGVHAATTDTALIRKWWQTWPEANVAIAAGRSGLVVVDVDVKGRVDGRASLAALERDLGPLPRTTTASTPSGGEHRYFRADMGEETSPMFRPSAGHVGGIDAPGVDIRAGASYVLAPPSQVGGRRYQWTVRVPPVELPRAWVEALTVEPKPGKPNESRGSSGAATSVSRGTEVGRSDRYAAAALDGECSDVATCPPGSRNHRLNRASFSLGQLVASGDLDEDTVRERLLAAAAECGLGPREARKTIRSGLRAGMENPRMRGAA